MANTSTQATRSTKVKAPTARRTGQGTSTNRTGATAERDDTYGLISVIYHSLQGAETCAKYQEDARRAKNQELVRFFEDCRIELNERALQGRSLLAAYLEGMDDEPEDELEDDDAELADEG